MDAFKKNIQSTIAEMHAIADLFYKQQNAEGIGRLDHLLTGLSALPAEIAKCVKEQELVFDLNQYVQILTESMHALEEKDYVLFADILRYDLQGLLEALL